MLPNIIYGRAVQKLYYGGFIVLFVLGLVFSFFGTKRMKTAADYSFRRQYIMETNVLFTLGDGERKWFLSMTDLKEIDHEINDNLVYFYDQEFGEWKYFFKDEAEDGVSYALEKSEDEIIREIIVSEFKGDIEEILDIDFFTFIPLVGMFLAILKGVYNVIYLKKTKSMYLLKRCPAKKVLLRCVLQDALIGLAMMVVLYACVCVIALNSFESIFKGDISCVYEYVKNNFWRYFL